MEISVHSTLIDDKEYINVAVMFAEHVMTDEYSFVGYKCRMLSTINGKQQVNKTYPYHVGKLRIIEVCVAVLYLCGDITLDEYTNMKYLFPQGYDNDENVVDTSADIGR